MAHIEADPSTAPEKSNALIDSGNEILHCSSIDFSIMSSGEIETWLMYMPFVLQDY